MSKKFFKITSNIFSSIIGKEVTSFKSSDDFFDYTRNNASRICKNFQKNGIEFFSELITFYEEQRPKNLIEAKEINSSKLVLGGRIKFLQPQLDGIKRVALYTDTILIPDPIQPFFENAEQYEQLNFPLFLENLFMILQLKPLADLRLDNPLIHIFQSYEKSLQVQDEFTKNGIDNLGLAFFTKFLGIRFYNTEELLEFVTKYEATFLDRVSLNNLFIGPSGRVDKALKDHLEDYNKFVEEYRTDEYKSIHFNSPNSLKIWKGIVENLSHQWHLLDNTEALEAHPLLIRESHFHYFKLISQLYEDRFESNFIDSKTKQTISALSQQKFQWLGNVPIEEIARLKQEGETDAFVKEINFQLDRLSGSSIEDINTISLKVSKALTPLLKEHEKEARIIERRYLKKHSENIIGGWMSFAAAMFPSLLPLAGLSISAFAGKFLWNAYEEEKDRKKLANSLLGILASSHRKR